MWLAQNWSVVESLHNDITQARAQSNIRKGQQAWGRIKATAEEQRILWLEVGVALMYGKLKENRADGQKFSEWVSEKFPGLSARYASAALWCSDNSAYYAESLEGVSDPIEAQRLIGEHQATKALPSDLQDITPTPAVVLSQRDAERVAKVVLRASSGDEGAAIASRHLDGLAKKHGTTEEGLKEAAKVGAPDTYFRFSPTVQLQLDDFRAGLRESIAPNPLP